MGLIRGFGPVWWCPSEFPAPGPLGNNTRPGFRVGGAIYSGKRRIPSDICLWNYVNELSLHSTALPRSIHAIKRMAWHSLSTKKNSPSNWINYCHSKCIRMPWNNSTSMRLCRGCPKYAYSRISFLNPRCWTIMMVQIWNRLASEYRFE